MHNNIICIKAICHNWTLQQILNEAVITEQAQLQAKEMKQKLENSECYRVKFLKKKKLQNQPKKIQIQITNPKIDEINMKISDLRS